MKSTSSTFIREFEKKLELYGSTSVHLTIVKSLPRGKPKFSTDNAENRMDTCLFFVEERIEKPFDDAACLGSLLSVITVGVTSRG